MSHESLDTSVSKDESIESHVDVDAGFQVERLDDISLNQLLALQGEGASVMRTPHVGNSSAANLTWMSQGGRTVLFDRNIGTRDKNYHPHLIISEGESIEISDPTVLTTHSEVTADVSHGGVTANKGQRISDVHTRGLRTTFPGFNPLLDSTYLRDHDSVAGDVLNALRGEFEELWTRKVDEEGHVHDMLPGTFEADPNNVFLFTHGQQEDKGLLLPVMYTALIYGVTEALEYNTDVVYHLSGPDMVNYLPQMQEQLAQAYEHVRSRTRWGHHLPERLSFRVVPADSARFIVPTDEQVALDTLVDSFLFINEEVEALRKSKAEAIKGVAKDDQESRQAVIQHFDSLIGSHRDLLDEAVAACPRVFFNTADADYTTQYDLRFHSTEGQRGFYVHPWALDAPLSEVAKMYKQMAKIHQRITK